MRLSILLISPAAVAAVAVSAARAQSDDTRYVAPTSETVTATLEQGMGSVPAQIIWVQNNSTVPIHVYGVMLRNCENVRGDCGPRRVDIPIRAGGREIVQRVERQDADRGMHFNYGFSWRADSGSFNAIRMLARDGIVGAQERVSQHDAAVAAERAAGGAQDLMLTPTDLATLGGRVAGLRLEPDSVVVHVGQAFVMHQVRLLAIDSSGNVLGRVRGYRWRIPPGPLAVQAPDTVTAMRAGRTAAEFHLAAPAPTSLGAVLPIIAVADSTR